MDDTYAGKMTPGKTLHPRPCPATTTILAAAADYSHPKASYFVNEAADAATVVRDGMVVQPAPHNASQPSARFAQWMVHSLSQVRLDRLQGRTHAFGH